MAQKCLELWYFARMFTRIITINRTGKNAQTAFSSLDVRFLGHLLDPDTLVR